MRVYDAGVAVPIETVTLSLLLQHSTTINTNEDPGAGFSDVLKAEIAAAAAEGAEAMGVPALCARVEDGRFGFFTMDGRGVTPNAGQAEPEPAAPAEPPEASPVDIPPIHDEAPVLDGETVLETTVDPVDVMPGDAEAGV